MPSQSPRLLLNYLLGLVTGISLSIALCLPSDPLAMGQQYALYQALLSLMPIIVISGCLAAITALLLARGIKLLWAL